MYSAQEASRNGYFGWSRVYGVRIEQLEIRSQNMNFYDGLSLLFM